MVLMVALYLLGHFELTTITSLLRVLTLGRCLVARSTVPTAGRLNPSGLLRRFRMTLMGSLSHGALFNKLSAGFRTLDVSRFCDNRTVLNHIFSIFHAHEGLCINLGGEISALGILYLLFSKHVLIPSGMLKRLTHEVRRVLLLLVINVT